MHNRGGGMGMENGKGGSGMGRNGYRRDYRPPDRGNFVDRSGGGGGGGSGVGASQESSVSKGTYANEPAKNSQHAPADSPQAAVASLEKQLSGVQQDFNSALHKISEKENEKFDLIFAILSELQSRQAQLEESVRALKAQYGPAPGNGTSPTMSQSQQGFSGNSNGQSYGMNGQMNGNMNTQQGMQQFAGVMQGDGTQAMFTAMPQVLVVSSPTGGMPAGMQYAVPQIMSPTNMQAMPQQMAMFPVGQNSGQDMGSFMSGQDTSSSGGAQQGVNQIADSSPETQGEDTEKHKQ